MESAFAEKQFSVRAFLMEVKRCWENRSDHVAWQAAQTLQTERSAVEGHTRKVCSDISRKTKRF